MEKAEVTKHPDYKAGYFAALEGKPMGFVSAEFDAGYEAGKRAKSLLVDAGFKQTGTANFSKTTTIK